MKALKVLRVLVAAGLFTLVTLFFLGLGGGFGLLERIQLVPALLGCALVPLAAWLVVTLLFGRVYCSLVCPLGILQDVLGRLFHWRKYAPTRVSYRTEAARVLFWSLLVFVGALGGVSLIGLIDPYSVFGRIAALLLQPVAETGNNLLADGLGTDGAVVLFKREVFVRSVSGFIVAGSSLVLLATLVAWRGRIFCNMVCPVGALLAMLSRKTLFRIAIDPALCVKCGLCSGVCKAQCLDGKTQTVDDARCVRCFNCLGACPGGAISFAPMRMTGSVSPDDKARRGFLTGAGCLAFGAVFSGKRFRKADAPRALPPPGADEASLRRKCTACGLCVARCPRKVIAPAGVSEYGPLGFMMPRMDFARGFCDPNCTVCGEVCPTGAIRPLDRAAKRQVKIGRAVFDRTRCLACTEKISCGLCERRCPQKAITLKEREVPNGEKTIKIKVPVVDAAKCTGCGACENYCPSHAMTVGSVCA